MSTLQYPNIQQADNETFLDIWRAACDQHPDYAAIEEHGQLSTYLEIDNESSVIADRLRQANLCKGDIVGIAERRGKNLLVAMLGAMKAGVAFVFLDLDQPNSRLREIIQTASVSTVLASDPAAVADFPSGLTVVTIGEVGIDKQAVADWAEPTIEPDDLAYVIFTSGSTGKPKCILLSHRGIPNLARHAVTYGIDKASRVLMFSPVGFDAIIAEIVMTLQANACLVVLPDEDLKDIGQLEKALSERQIDVATLPPSLVATLSPTLATSLTTLIVAGERCSSTVINNWAGKVRLLNAYGPSEATVASSLKLCTPDTHSSDIGSAIANVRIDLLDAHLRPVVHGEVGEICISGVGVADGYLGDNAGTRARFIPSLHGAPFRAFRSGDFARRDKHGSLIFLGRRDDMVKINGNRIELAEIETQAATSKAVSSCFAAADTEGETSRIALFVILKEGQNQAASEEDIRARLTAQLPAYFMPTHIKFVAEFPHNASGKVDKKTLLNLLTDTDESVNVTQDAFSPLEARLAIWWGELLGCAVNSSEANFFAMGGNSLLAMRLVAMLKKDTFSVTLKDVFRNPSLSEMAVLLEEHK